MSNRVQRIETFFVSLAWLLPSMVIISFGSKAVFDTENLSPLTWQVQMIEVSSGLDRRIEYSMHNIAGETTE